MPARAAGRPALPGQVNPVVPEVVSPVAFESFGNDTAVTMASEARQRQLNAFEPVMGFSRFGSIMSLQAACFTPATNCIDSMGAAVELLAHRVQTAAGLATALDPHIGYEATAEIAQIAQASAHIGERRCLAYVWMFKDRAGVCCCSAHKKESVSRTYFPLAAAAIAA